jgi:hypothetical protein
MSPVWFVTHVPGLDLVRGVWKSSKSVVHVHVAVAVNDHVND